MKSVKKILKKLKKALREGPMGTFALLGAAVAIFFAGALLLWVATLRLPDVDAFEARKAGASTKIYDRTGDIVLYDLHGNVRRSAVPFEEISRHVKNATVAIEDEDFYQHNGIQIKSIIRAVLVNLGSIGFTQGGSTITQQVIKNSLLTREKTITRKIKEWVLAIKLEQRISKEEILSMYLNDAPYGGNVYGIEEAAQMFFGTTAADLTLAQSAYLAALPQAPTYYSPYGSHRDRLEERKNLVLARMKKNNFITDAEYEAARQEEVEFRPKSDGSIKAPHFVFYVREYLEEKYGARALEENGLRVITTLDYDLQKKAEEIVREGAAENETKFNAANAGMVAIDPTTGHVLAMVGSRDYFADPRPAGCTPGRNCTLDPQVNVTLARRQPGSSFKPYVYATAFKKGYTPETVVFDLPTQFSTSCDPSNLSGESPCYSPQNYDTVFRGPISLKNALAQSVNVPSVKVLYLAGINASIKTAQDLGITTLADRARYGLTLVLGGGEVTLLEMAGAYGVFAHEGIKNPTTPILKIEDNTGKVLEEFAERPMRVLDRNIALQITDILSDNAARAPAFGERSALYFADRPVAVKTGTTNDYKDAWVIGYTPKIVIGAWAGNSDNTPMQKNVAGFIIAPLWHEFMEAAVAKMPVESFASPRRDDSRDLKPVLAGSWQGSRVSGGSIVPEVHSILHWVSKDDPRGPIPSNPTADPQYWHWEAPVRAWALANGYGGSNISGGGDGGESDMNVRISGLKREYDEDETVSFTLAPSGGRAFVRADIFVNNVYVGRVDKAPFSFSFTPSDVDGIKRANTLRIVVYDAAGQGAEAERQFRVDG